MRQWFVLWSKGVWFHTIAEEKWLPHGFREGQPETTCGHTRLFHAYAEDTKGEFWGFIVNAKFN